MTELSFHWQRVATGKSRSKGSTFKQFFRSLIASQCSLDAINDSTNYYPKGSKGTALLALCLLAKTFDICFMQQLFYFRTYFRTAKINFADKRDRDILRNAHILKV